MRSRLTNFLGVSQESRTFRGGETRSGFGRVELMAVLAVTALVLAVILPGFADDRMRANGIFCFNNLSRIAQALGNWAGDHEEKNPWEISRFSGGTGGESRASAHFITLSSYLSSPRVLVCPADGAKFFSTNLASLGDENVSYFLSHPTPSDGRAVLSGDRNVVREPNTVSCPNFGSAYWVQWPATNAGWSQSLHVRRGHLLFNDGSVEATDDAGLRQAMFRPTASNSLFHFIAP